MFKFQSYLSYALIANVFLSKMQISGFSMSTSVNLEVNILLGTPLLLSLLRGPITEKFNGVYLFFISWILVLFCVQNIAREQMVLQVGGIAATTALFLIYGVAIPAVIPVKRFLQALRMIMTFVLISSAILFFVGAPVFDGGRFSGIFRDNILFSQAALIGVTLFGAHLATSKSIWNWLGFAGFIFGIVLSGSRSALLIGPSCVMAFLLVRRMADLRFSHIRLALLCLGILIAPIWVSLISKIATGQLAIGSRTQVTNAVDDRMQHWGYGIDRVAKAPWTGEGVLSKYSGDSGINLSEFDESKDPHNLFLYAGQVGGLPLFIICLSGITILLIAVLRSFRFDPVFYQITAIILLLYVPMSLAGGSLISLGSMFDRIFWICAGYISVRGRRTQAFV